jgi:hypothetical protein
MRENNQARKKAGKIWFDLAGQLRDTGRELTAKFPLPY